MILAEHQTHGLIDLRRPVNRSHPLARGLVAWWKVLPGWFGGRQWFDLMGLNHGTLAGGAGPTWRSAAPPGGWGSLDFDGSSSTPSLENRVETPHVSGKAFTWLVRFKAGAQASTFTCFLAIPSPNFMLVSLNNSESLAFFTSDGLTNVPLGHSGSKEGQWFNLAFIREGDSITGGYKSYGNGLFTGSANTGVWSSTDVLWIGARGGVDQGYTGLIEEVAIYNRPLSAAEVRYRDDLSRRGWPGLLNRVPLRAFGAGSAELGDAGHTFRPRPRNLTFKPVERTKTFRPSPRNRTFRPRG